MKVWTSRGGYLNYGDLSSNHLAAVLNVGLGNSVRAKALVGQVCVSGSVAKQRTHIVQWATYWVMRKFFNSVVGRTVEDRYKKKADYYDDEIRKRMTPTMWSQGVPIVLRPLPCPGAIYEANTGTWDVSNVTSDTCVGAIGGQFDVVVTYVDMFESGLYISKDQPNNSESGPSATVPGVVVPVDSSLVIDIATLNPPSGKQNPATVLLSVVSGLAASHWNVYAGTSGGSLYLQNMDPIPIAQTSYQLTGDPVKNKYALGQGQYQARWLTILPTRQRS